MTRLVLLPGLDGTGRLFSALIAALGTHIKPVAIAYPPTVPLDSAQLETHIRERLPTDKPFVLLGESFSGPLAISLAAGAIPNLTALILCCSFVKNPRPALAGLKPLIRYLPDLRFSALASALLMGRFTTPLLRRELDEALAQVSLDAIKARLEAVINTNQSQALCRVRVPILYLRATRDRLVTPQASRTIAALAPQTRIVDIEGPHMLLQTAPGATAQTIIQFTSTLAAR
jgi:pimeloyl-ACP methyl ester carboxylesterase